MNIEIEIKVKIDNFEEIKSKVSSLGKLIKSVHQIDEYYIPIQRDFFTYKPQPIEHLRIRTNNDKSVFEYTRTINLKENLDYDYAEEYETGISDVEAFKKTLEFLDFKKIVTVDKEREYWMCGDIEVALDNVVGLGHFMEAEAKGNFKDEIEAKKACINFLESLGIKDVENTQVRQGYPSIFLDSLKNK